jgi:hypothetical protein
MNDITNATGGPVAVDVVFFSLANFLLLGGTAMEVIAA